MIKIDKSSVEFKGSIDIILAEMATLQSGFELYLEKNDSEFTHREALDMIDVSYRGAKLMRAGMDPFEALKIVRPSMENMTQEEFDVMDKKITDKMIRDGVSTETINKIKNNEG